MGHVRLETYVPPELAAEIEASTDNVSAFLREAAQERLAGAGDE